MHHVDVGRRAPKAYQALMALSAQTERDAIAAGLDQRLIELVRIRSSQLNGCAFCLRTHARDAVAAGETADRLSVVAAWWESQYFSPAERAALSIAERVTGVGDHRPARPDVDESALDDQQTAVVTWVAIAIGAWNRVAIVSRYPVAP